jgi:hypothetical protein
MAYSVEELKQQYPQIDIQKRILELRALGTLMGKSIIVPKYKVPLALHEPIAFTASGNELVRGLASSRSVNWGELRLAVFLRLYHDDLFIDPEKTDIAGIRKALSKEIQAGKVKYPFIFGRELYDKAFEEIENDSLRALDAPQTQRFLDGTSPGIFQLGETVVGPWGALQSREYRSVQPTRNPLLYHCEKPGCLTAHKIWLSTSDTRIKEVGIRLHKKLDQRAPSNWERFIGELHRNLSGAYDDWRSGGVIAFLGECFTSEELTSIAESAFSNRALGYREICFGQGISVRGADEFLTGKTKQQIIQMLLLLTDSEIVSAIDKSTIEGRVKVPIGEIRAPRLNRPVTGSFGTSFECSSQGVRVASDDPRVPMRRLQRLISEVYDEPNLKSRLDWKIRSLDGNSFEDRLRHYLAEEDVRKVVRDLFLSGPDVFSSAADKLTLHHLAHEEDHVLAARVSWRLGFPGVTHDTAASALRSRVKEMRNVTPKSSPSEDDKEKIRSQSVHLFVELEKSLDSALCFSTWLTRFDHWAAHPRFAYSHAEARKFMAETLTAQAETSGSDVTYDPSGVNTLGPLISGFGLLASHLEKIDAASEEFRRSSEDIPSVFRASTLLKFGYPYQIPFLNFSEPSKVAIVSGLRSIARNLSNGKVSGVRNSLEHHRESFPECADVLGCLDAIEEHCDTVERFGFIPVMFRMMEYTRDSFGRARFMFEDYSGRTVSVAAYSPVALTGQPGFSEDQILVPGVQIADSESIPRFSLGVTSSYTEMWSDWPRHRAVGLISEPMDDSSQGGPDISASESA